MKKKVVIIAALAVVLIIVALIVIPSLLNPPSKRYEAAVVLYNSGQFKQAAEEFHALKSYQDSIQYYTECMNIVAYQEAMVLYENGDWSQAAAEFKSLGSFSDSVTLYTEAKNHADYSDALEALNNGELNKAYGKFNSLGEYENSHLYVAYVNARIIEESKSWPSAAAAYDACGDFLDSIERAKYCSEIWDSVFSSHTGKVACGYEFSAILQSDGTVIASGDSTYKQCYVFRWSNIVSISAGARYIIGLKSDGTVTAAGLNDQGQCDVSNWSDVVMVKTDGDIIVGLTEAGKLLFAPERVSNTWSKAKNWSDIVAFDIVDAYHDYIVGVKRDGTVVEDGEDTLGLSSWVNIVDVAVSPDSFDGMNVIGLREDGLVVAAGHNSDGQCDVRAWKNIEEIWAFSRLTIGKQSNGTLVTAGESSEINQYLSRLPNIVDVSIYGSRILAINDSNETFPENWMAIQAISYADGYNSNPLLFALTSSGHVLVGSNYMGETNISYNPEPIVDTWENILSIVAGEGFCAGLRDDGKLYVVGEIGESDTDSGYAETIQNIENIHDAVKIGAGRYHLMVLHEDGTVSVWGRQQYTSDIAYASEGVDEWSDIIDIQAAATYSVGLTSKGTVVSTAPVGSYGYGVDNWDDVIQIDACETYVAGLRSDGTVLTTKDGPDVRFWSNIKDISAGYSFIVGLTNDNKVVALDKGSAQINEVNSWTDVVEIIATGDCIIALKSDGTVLTYGYYNPPGKGGSDYDIKQNWTNVEKIYAATGNYGYTYGIVGILRNGRIVSIGINVLGLY